MLTFRLQENSGDDANEAEVAKAKEVLTEAKKVQAEAE